MQLGFVATSAQVALRMRGMKLPWNKSRTSDRSADHQRSSISEAEAAEDAVLAAKLERAQGALMGVMVADAAGASIEGLDRQPTAKEVEQACLLEQSRFPAGGVSDDSELTIALALGLTGDPRDGPLLERCARNYLKWRRSPPTSMGRATRNAFSADLAQRNQAAEMLTRTALLNSGSEANGALMRAAPLGIALHNLKTDHIASIAAMDSQLSHPSRPCQDANAVYSIALASLVQDGDPETALQSAEAWAEANAGSTVRAWLAQSRQEEVPFGYEECGQQSMGWVKWAFVITFWHLRRKTPFTQALHEVLLLGGDTDTNAAICCGMLGALWGVQHVPRPMKAAVVGCEDWRPAWLMPRQVPGLAKALLQLKDAQLLSL